MPSLEAVIAAMASFFVFTILLAIVFLVCKSRQPKSRSSGQTTLSRAVPNPPRLTSVAVDESTSFDPSLRVSMSDIIVATKSFSPDLIVGDGSFGFVYKAQLPNGPLVAIKKLDPDAFQGFREFRAEMETLSKLQHKNLVRILGYCVSGSDRILIYEFIERGNLDFWLHDYSSSSSSLSSMTEGGGGDSVSGLRLPLSWETRAKIVLGVANGLCYLHGLDKPIIHRDIKASNVLLDSEFEAHISDFGLARMIDSSHSHVSTQFAGTMGYMPPEYKEGLTAATVKADVYSFGILMLETATGKRPNLPQKYDGKEMGWVEWARKMVDHNRQMEMVDQNISRQGLDEARVKEYFRVACMCVNEMSKNRPTICNVVGLLKQNSN